MSTGKGAIKIYEAVLSGPGMTEKCKLVFHLSRLNIILLTRLIESGLQNRSDNPEDIINLLPKESIEELQAVVDEILRRGNLTDFYQKFKSLAL